MTYQGATFNNNGGFNNFGPNATFHGPISVGGAAPAVEPGRAEARAEVGVLTVLDTEMRAVDGVLRRMYDYRERRLPHGPLASEAWLPESTGRRVRVAAVQALRPGTEPAALAYRGLIDEYHPATVLLVGVAGGIGRAVRIGDVVLADQVIAYDARRETRDGALRRGVSQTVSADLGHRLNEFVRAVPADHLRTANGPFRLYRGPIGSGNAVVTDAHSEIRRWLHDFHEKVLAVETESAGVAESFHESLSRDGVRGWLTIRGISDTADAAKGHGHHALAAGHAALVMAMLLPYLYFETA